MLPTTSHRVHTARGGARWGLSVVLCCLADSMTWVPHVPAGGSVFLRVVPCSNSSSSSSRLPRRSCGFRLCSATV